ncbi:hypothetical protein [Streptosporangium sp. NPDC023615]|uniref:hypothetical protein n=1 Tax=Streptosporangium sp. NPDC023615 TaxID=3154794 RepID=UPI003421CE84
MRQRFAAALTALVAFTAVMAVPGTACACSCVALRPSQQVERAAVVFTGTVVALRQGRRSTTEPPPPIVYAFRVDQVYKGRDRIRKEQDRIRRGEDRRVHGRWAGARIEVASNENGAACGYSFAVGSRHLVFASDARGGLIGKDPGVALSTSLCLGNRRVRPGDGPLRGRDGIHAGEPLSEELLAALGTARSPSEIRARERRT